MKLRTTHPIASLSCLALFAMACDATVPSGPSSNSGVFESDSPSGQNTGSKSTPTASMDAAAGGSNAAGRVASEANQSATTENAEAARAIEEADIIKIEGSRLYAISQYGGLSVIDIGTRDHMRLLGRKKVQAQPFEMYVRDQKVFALYNGYGEYVEGAKDGEWSWVTTSYVMAFDTTDPQKPSTIGQFSIPGVIQDSRIVGNAMYVVGYESNGCWGCADGEHTTVISLDVSTPSAIRKVDERSYADDSTTSYSWKRSVSVTDKRMYIAGPEYGNGSPVGSVIQVVDISDPNGKLVDGAKVSAAGRIDSRWQMDESDGVLRVISQPGDWRPADPPRIQTFAVASAQSVTQLAAVDMVVPADESLRSVRFDGPRGYAITAVQTDPLFTIDLSNPAQPRQVGELVMPGWIYYMEPRGDRVVALGYDQGNSAGALTVSLFDVADLAKPAMLDRVNFGGDWSWIVEDQDRVHKAFQVLDASNLVLMPFSGYSNDEGNCYSKWVSGVQLIDWAGDQLTLQGVAPTVGQARRGFLHDSRLFTVSDERVESFDIANRSQPKITDSLKLTQKVTRTIDAGTAVVKVGEDWYSNSVSLDTTTLAAVEDPSSNGHIDVTIGSFSCNSSSNLGQVVAKDGKVYLLINEYNWDSSSGKNGSTTKLITVDVTQPSQPKVLGEASLDFGQGWQYWYNAGLVNAGAAAVVAGNAIVTMGREDILETKTDGSQQWVGTRSKVYVIDPANPTKPTVSVVKLPESLGTTGLLASDNVVGVGHYVQSPSDSGRVRFYLDRIDVSDPNHPQLTSGVNIPGSPVAYEASASNVVSVDYRNVLRSGVTADWCRSNYPYSWFEYPNSDYSETAKGNCHSVQQTLYLVGVGETKAGVIGSKTLDVGEWVTNVTVGDDRVFMTVGAGYGYYGGMATVDCFNCGRYYGYYSVQTTDLPLLVVGGLRSGDFATGRATLSGGDYWNYAPMVASGKRVLLSTGWQGKLSVVDGSDAAAPKLVRQADLYGNAQSLAAIDGVGIASLYYDGVQTIRMDD